MLERRRIRGFLAAALALVVAACAPPVPRETPAGQGGPVPGPGALQARPGTVYRIVASDVAVRVYRDGPLAQLGHNHVIASTAVEGWVALQQPMGESTFSLTLPWDSLVVDDPSRRRAAGEDFPGELDATARDATRRNMLGASLLDAQQFPSLQLRSVALHREADGWHARTRVELAGTGGEIDVPVALQVTGDELAASGHFAVTHAQLGLAPFTAALGALRVREDLHVSYTLRARREQP